MKKQEYIDKLALELRDEILRIGNRAVKEAQLESLKRGVPTVYMLNNTMFYQLPNGEITSKLPNEFKD